MILARALLSGLALLPSMLSAAPSSTPTDLPNPTLEAFVDHAADEGMTADRLPGMVVTVVRDGAVMLNKGYGYANVETQLPVDPDRSLFRIGSITKLFTYTAIGQLLEQGQIDLDVEINRYLPAALIEQDPAAPVTANTLMAHRAGFESADLGYGFNASPDTVPTLEAFVRERQPARVHPAGQVTAYSNYGISLLGLAVQHLAGRPYAEQIRQRILRPLGMQHTTMDETSAESARALGYASNGDSFQVLPLEYIAPAAAPAGAMFSTGTDMSRFLRAYLAGGELDNERILKPETIQTLWTRHYTDRPHGPDLAHGFFNRRMHGRNTYYHGGFMLGYTANLLLVPELDLGIFVAVNSSAGEHLTATLSRDILDFLDNSTPALEPPAEGVDLRPFAGRYLTSRRSYTKQEKLIKIGLGEARVEPQDGNHLLIHWPGETRVWVPLGPLRFRDAENDDIVQFEADDHGKIVRLYTPDGHQAFERISWRQSSSYLLYALGAAVLLSLSLLIGRRKAGSRWVWLRRVTALSTLGFVVLFGLAAHSLSTEGLLLLFHWPTPELRLASWGAKWLAAVAVITTLALIPLWWRRHGSTASRIHFTLTVLALLWLMDALWIWNMFRSPYN